MKAYWLDLMAHVYARDAAIFLFYLLMIVFFVIRWSMKEDAK